MEELGRLHRVELREVWLSESSNFTPWLAQLENIEILANTLGVDLEVEAQEKNVGPFRADILCKDTGSDAWVLIENQLERTDHNHLGQLLTYASGLQAVTIVWIAAKFTEEHRAALDWLNEITDDSFQFFGLEVELWRIGNSKPAPRFNVVSKPNTWTKSVSSAARQLDDAAISETRVKQKQYWARLSAYLEENQSAIRARLPRPQHWTTFSIGRSGFQLTAKVNTVDNRLGAELFIRKDSDKELFHQLIEDKASIENEFGHSLSWEKLPERQGSRVAIYRENSDPIDESDWQHQHAWFLDMLTRFDRTFRKRVQNLEVRED